MSDWYDKAKEAFMVDLYFDAEVSPEDAKKVYSVLVNFGLIDYDIEKDFLWDQYGEELDG